MENASNLFKDSVGKFESVNDENYRNALTDVLYGAATGNIEQIKQGLEYDKKLINATESDSSNGTALHMVASGTANNKEEVIKFLIKQGADPRIIDDEGLLPSECVINNPTIKKMLEGLEDHAKKMKQLS
jgi:hypothetical protein